MQRAAQPVAAAQKVSEAFIQFNQRN